MNEHREDIDWLNARKRMIEDQIRSRGISDPNVLEAMTFVPRELFVPQELRHQAYEDRALVIQHDQTISQPFIVAYMTAQLDVSPEARILEIGTGTGYQTAILARLGRHVDTVERWVELKDHAERIVAQLNIQNVSFHIGDGSMGWADHAPYDRVIVTAGAPCVPASLVEQLTDGGVLVMPVGKEQEQTIVRIVRKGSRTVETPSLPCRFVKLIGQQGWPSNDNDPAS